MHVGLQAQEGVHHGRESHDQHRDHHVEGDVQQECGRGSHALSAGRKRPGGGEHTLTGKGFSYSLATVVLGVLCQILAGPEPGDHVWRV